ncbi:hypothetical protein HMPREF1565_1104 [Providencia alcalifaciens RIMD 1656011]|nr:hypothetical protein HMPREF1565_1104 [Providencia alcalifaciens RIMD 1656011]
MRWKNNEFYKFSKRGHDENDNSKKMLRKTALATLEKFGIVF